MSHLGRLKIVQKAVFSNTLKTIFKGHKKTFITSSVSYEEYQTMAEIKKKLEDEIKPEPYHSKQSAKPKMEATNHVQKSQSELPVRKMKDSFDTAVIPLSSDLMLREKYTTSFEGVRLGRLMEDLDLMAVWCCFKHICGCTPKSQEPFPYNIVTILVDSIEIISKSNQRDADIRISGHVCWVGKSSLEVLVWMDQFVNGRWEKVLRALVLMAARDRVKDGPGFVNPIEAETPEEAELLSGGEARRKKRTEMKDWVVTNDPSEEEFRLIHSLFVATVDQNDFFFRKRILPPKGKWMHDATLKNLVFCHPEHRNLHNKIFGGFLIRQALELSWCIAAIHGLRIPQLIHISDINFHNPVDVGSFLKLYGTVTYTEKTFIQVFVYANIFSLSKTKRKSTTSFNFTYDLKTPCDQVYPSTYLEAMTYINGRRRFQRVKSQSLSDIK